MPYLRVCNTITLKSIEDDKDKDDGLVMVTSLVQRVFGTPEMQINDKGEINDKKLFFPYRFNEQSPNGEMLEQRRTRAIKGSETVIGSMTTFQANIPLEVEPLFSYFPFQVSVAKASIELSSVTEFGEGETFRPDFVLHTKDPRNNFNIQNLDASAPDETLLDGIGSCSRKMDGICKPKECLVHKILDKIDKSQSYDFMSPHPRIYYQYDTDKKYCPRVVVSFFVNKFSFRSFVNLILPMILVAAINSINVMNDLYEKVDVVDHLQVSSALTLTIVFILPQIVDSSNRGKVLSRGNFVVIVYFLGMLLSSIPKSIFEGGAAESELYAIPELIGMALMWFSVLIPTILHSYEYASICMRLKKQAKAETGVDAFLMGTEAPNWKPKSSSDGVSSVKEILEEKNDNYEVGKKEQKRYSRLHFKPNCK